MEKIKMNVEDIMKEYNLTGNEFAAKTGLCISLVSKIKHCETTITKRSREAIERAFPGIELIGGKERWKDLYLEILEEYKNLKNELARKEKRIEFLEKRIYQIHTMTANDTDYYAVRKFEGDSK